MRAIVSVVASIAIIGCVASDSTGTENSSSPSIRYAKGGGSVHPLANYSFADSVNVAPTSSPASWSIAGIQGDGRMKDGAPSTGGASNEYQGNFCGVYAVAGLAQAPEGFNTDADIYWTSSMAASCGSARGFRFFLGGLSAAPTLVGPHTLIDVSALAVGQIATRLARFGVHLPNCAGIRFGDAYPLSSNVRVTRLPDVVSADGVAKSWRIESQGSHRGACMIQGKKDLVPTGVYPYLPFALTLTEVWPPFTTFP